MASRATVCLAPSLSSAGDPLGVLRRELLRHGSSQMHTNPVQVFMRPVVVFGSTSLNQRVPCLCLHHQGSHTDRRDLRVGVRDCDNVFPQGVPPRHVLVADRRHTRHTQAYTKLWAFGLIGTSTLIHFSCGFAAQVRGIQANWARLPTPQGKPGRTPRFQVLLNPAGELPTRRPGGRQHRRPLSNRNRSAGCGWDGGGARWPRRQGRGCPTIPSRYAPISA